MLDRRFDALRELPGASFGRSGASRCCRALHAEGREGSRRRHVAPCTHDGAGRSADRGYFRTTGRIDDVRNVSGHRLGTMEIESALVSKTDLVAEAAVVGRPDGLTGEAVCAFVVPKRARPTGEEARQIANELRNRVAKEIGPIASPGTSAAATTCPRRAAARMPEHAACASPAVAGTLASALPNPDAPRCTPMHPGAHQHPKHPIDRRRPHGAARAAPSCTRGPTQIAAPCRALWQPPGPLKARACHERGLFHCGFPSRPLASNLIDTSIDEK